MHVATLVALGAVEYVPSVQMSHAPPPTAALYVPRAHALHPTVVLCVSSSKGLVNPALHLQ